MKIKTKKGILVDEATLYAEEKKRSDDCVNEYVGDMNIEMSDKLKTVWMVASTLLDTSSFFDTIRNIEKHGELYPANVWAMIGKGFLRYCRLRLKTKFLTIYNRRKRKV